MASKNPQKTILFLGDSLTAGYGLPSRDQAYPAIVGRLLEKQGFNCHIINGGISGSTSAGGDRRVAWHFRRRIDVLFLALGANDGLRGMKVSETRRNLKKIIESARKRNPQVKVIVAGMLVPPNMGQEYSDSFRKTFPKLATDNNCSLVPFLLEGVAGEVKLNQADGIHPTYEGQKKIADNILGKIKIQLQ